MMTKDARSYYHDIVAVEVNVSHYGVY
jgi:hypothetical protein